MPALSHSFTYDPDRWIHVPLDYAGTSWTDAAAWAQWLSSEATNGREDGELFGPAVRRQALAVALFPAAHVSARFWHYPIDADPSGFVDLYLQARTDDGAPPADLLPDTGSTAVEPVLEQLAIPAFHASVRRLTLGVVVPEGDAEPVLLPRAEWIGTTPQWVCYARSVDHDVDQLESRLADIDALFAAVDLSGAGAR